MAARENQGLFIAVILLVLISVVLAVLTYFAYTNMKEAVDNHASVKEQLAVEENARKAYEAQAGILKAFIGFDNEAIGSIQTYRDLLQSSGEATVISETSNFTTLYDQDMAKASSFEENTLRTYRNLIGDISDAMVAQHGQTIEYTNRALEAEQELATAKETFKNQLAEKDNQIRVGEEKLQAAETRYRQTQDEYKQLLTEADRKYTDVNRQLTELRGRFDQLETDSDRELAAKAATIQRQNEEITELTRTETDVFDGQIVSVAPILGKVVINLGSGDNLRLQQTFAIYDQSISAFRSGEGKATIEVTRILGEHLAEARITSQNHVNPILTRDFVVTATWDPGYSVPVAIAGRIDLDGDGRSDLRRLISIVEGTGFGNVVAYHDDEGKVTGEINEETRLFVVGDEALSDGRAGYNRLLEQQKRFQTRRISVQAFLNEMGYRSEAKIQQFEEDATPTASSGFETRQPQTTVETDDPFGG